LIQYSFLSNNGKIVVRKGFVDFLVEQYNNEITLYRN